MTKTNFSAVYFSRGGNTRKVAQAIAEELGVSPVDVKMSKPDVNDADLLVVGSGTYGGKPASEVTSFLEGLSPTTGKKAARFSTCAGDAQKSLASMRDILAGKEYSVIDCFACFGKFALVSKRGHPTIEELNQATEFAKKPKASV
jgi:flavodoxin